MLEVDTEAVNPERRKLEREVGRRRVHMTQMQNRLTREKERRVLPDATTPVYRCRPVLLRPPRTPCLDVEVAETI